MFKILIEQRNTRIGILVLMINSYVLQHQSIQFNSHRGIPLNPSKDDANDLQSDLLHICFKAGTPVFNGKWEHT